LALAGDDILTLHSQRQQPPTVVCKQKNDMKNLIIIAFLIFAKTMLGQDIKVKDCFNDDKVNLKFCIASDKETFDKHFGDSYRLFLITDMKTDSVITKFYLDVNRSADFAYKLISDFYQDYKIIIIKGVASFYIYSPTKKEISKNIYPNYADCSFSDGQGSFIKDIKVVNEGKLLTLDVIECGKHKFNIQNLENIYEIK